MSDARLDPAAELARALAAYRVTGNLAGLRTALDELFATSELGPLVALAESYRDDAELAVPLYERVVAARPDDPRALVILANAYWLTGCGPDAVGALATRAIAADAASRAAWHLWALSEPDPRARTARWQQVCARFPEDELARANLADNAASLAGAEHDALALALALETYESLLATATRPEQRAALERAISTLRDWRL